MSKRGIGLLAAAVTALVALSCCSCSGSATRDIPALDRLKKSYAKINKYLEKEVQSSANNAVINMAKVEQMLAEKSSKSTLFSGKSLVDTLLLLHEFASVPSDDTVCNRAERIKLLETIDSGLNDESRFRGKLSSYRLSRLDRIIEHYAYENALRCKFIAGYNAWPSMDYGLKQLAYDQLNDYLVEELPHVEDVWTNMVKIEELNRRSGPPDGALADAAKQLLMLRSTVREDTCNEKGFEILLKNDLATRGKAHRWHAKNLRRIDAIFKHYAKRHEELCRPIVRKTLGLELKRLDLDAYRRVFGLTSAYYLSTSQFFRMKDELYQLTSVGETFTIPLTAREFVDTFEPFGRLEQISHIPARKLYEFVKVISDTKDKIYLKTVLNVKTGERYVDDAQIFKLIDKYLLEPCSKFIKVYGPPVEADEYGMYMNDGHFRTIEKDRFAVELTYHMIRAGYQACKYVTEDRLSIFHEFVLYTKDAQ